MKTCPTPQIPGALKKAIIGAAPIFSLALIMCLASFAQRHQEPAAPAAHASDLQRFAADARSAAALLHYLTEAEPPIIPQGTVAKIKTSPPLVTQSNYSRLVTTKNTDPS